MCYRLRAPDDPIRVRAEAFTTAGAVAQVYVRFRRAGD